jgi:hypothetical protein
MKKGYLDISFSWIFAIIVGGFILFFAITSVSKLGNIKQTSEGAIAGVELEILLNPLETGLETGKTTTLTMPVYSRIYFDCDNYGDFGNHYLMVQEQVKKEWKSTGINIKFENKYLFSNSIIDGKNFYLFTKPFEFPFKVGSLIYMTSSEDEYCFKNPPEEIEKELKDLSQPNIFVNDCKENQIKVCFEASSDCQIKVNYNLGYVEKKEGKSYFYTDALMYAAIFSDSTAYECELQRVLKKTSNLATIYQEKGFLLVNEGCTSDTISELTMLKNQIENFQSSSNINNLVYVIKDLEKKNENARCRLW